MKPYTLFLLSLFLACRIYAQAPIAFERYYDFGWGNSEEGFCVQQTFDGGYIIAGRQIQGIGFSKMLLHKVDSLGNTEWTKFIGSAYDNEAYSVKQTSDSGYILTGYTTDINYTNFLNLVKTDASGNVIWSKNNISPIAALPQGGPGGGRGTDVLQTSDGGYAMLAIMTDWDTTSAAVLIKTDANGDTLWTKKYKRAFGIGFYSFQQLPDGSFIMGGVINVSLIPVDQSIYLLKTNVNGDTLWSKIYAFTGENSGCFNVVQTIDSGFFLRGSIYHPSTFSTDILIMKTDSVGDSLWSRTIGGTLNEGGFGGQQTSDGGYIVCGGTTSYGAGGVDVFLVKTDNNGNQIWYKTFGGGNNDQGDYVRQTNDGGFIISGYSGSFGDGGSEYLIKTDSAGNAPTGIALINDNMDLHIYPNPSNGVFNIRGSKTNVQKIEAFNQLGEKIYGSVPENFQDIISVDISENPSGIYLLVIHDTNGTTLTKKIIVSH